MTSPTFERHRQLIGNDYYLDIILPQKIEIQPGLYMLGSKLGRILSGRTSETAENTAEPSMLILTYGTDVNRETTLITHIYRQLTSFETKPGGCLEAGVYRNTRISNRK